MATQEATVTTIAEAMNQLIGPARSYKADYENLKPHIDAVPRGKVLSPSAPVDVVTQEAFDVGAQAIVDRVQLEKANLDFSVVQSIPAYAGAFVYLSQVLAESLVQSASQRSLLEQTMLQLHDDRGMLGNSIRYALRDKPAAMALMAQIANGSRQSDQLLDTEHMVHMVRENPDDFKRINFDMVLLDAIDERTQRARAIVAASRTTADEKGLREERDRAYTLLKGVVDTIRDCGKYVFYSDPQKAAAYASDFARRKRSGSGSAEKSSGSSTPAADSSTSAS